MRNGKPIIGIAGGIGSGKSFVARLFGELGCRVIHADDQVRLAYDDPAVRHTIREWWGDQVFQPDGNINRSQIAARIGFVLQKTFRPRLSITGSAASG